jgi:hypothetical protein
MMPVLSMDQVIELALVADLAEAAGGFRRRDQRRALNEIGMRLRNILGDLAEQQPVFRIKNGSAE